MFICSIVAVYSINLFGPTIVKQFDPTAPVRNIQALVIPIFLAFAAATLAVSYASDKLRHRYALAKFGWVLTLIGLVTMINQRRVSVNAPATQRSTSSPSAATSACPSCGRCW